MDWKLNIIIKMAILLKVTSVILLGFLLKIDKVILNVCGNKKDLEWQKCFENKKIGELLLT